LHDRPLASKDPKSVLMQVLMPPPQVQHMSAAVKSASPMLVTEHMSAVYLLHGLPFLSVAPKS